MRPRRGLFRAGAALFLLADVFEGLWAEAGEELGFVEAFGGDGRVHGFDPAVGVVSPVAFFEFADGAADGEILRGGGALADHGAGGAVPEDHLSAGPAVAGAGGLAVFDVNLAGATDV